MSEEAKSEARPEELARQLDELASELKAIGASASRRGKITAWVLIIVWAIVALYLIFFVTPRVRKYVRPEALVGYAADQLQIHEADVMESLKASVPRFVDTFGEELEKVKDNFPKQTDKLAQEIIARMPEWVDQLGPQMEELKTTAAQKREELAERLKGAAPDTMANVRPQLEALVPKIPAMTEKFGDTLVKQAPSIADSLRDNLIKVLPSARRMLVERLQQQLAESTEQLDDVVDAAVMKVIDQHKQDIAALSGADLSERLQAGFEEAAGPVLDEFARPLGTAIKGVRSDLADLLARAPDRLSREEELELRLVQLANTYFKVRAETGP